jgi:hypothetical protein
MVLGNIFNMSGFPNSSSSSVSPNNSNQNLIQKFAEFKKTMEGKDPEAIVKQLLAEGKMTQQQFENFKQQASSLMSILR